MIIVFQCYGGTHTSVVAASLYIGLIPRNRPPEYTTLLNLPHFDRVDDRMVGGLNHIGNDSKGNPVFALGSRGHGAQMRLLMGAFLCFCPMTVAGVYVIDCMHCLTLATRAGGFISRRLGMPFLGRLLLFLGLRRALPDLLWQVESFEKNPHAYLLLPPSPQGKS